LRGRRDRRPRIGRHRGNWRFCRGNGRRRGRGRREGAEARMAAIVAASCESRAESSATSRLRCTARSSSA
jgi:hypothetical protein